MKSTESEMKTNVHLRLMQENDLPEVRKLVWDGLMSIEPAAMKYYVFRSPQVLGYIFMVALLVCSYSVNQFFTFIVACLIGLILALGALHLWLVKYEVGNMSGVGTWNEISKKYDKFWVAEMEAENGCCIVGSVAYVADHHSNSVELKRVSVSAATQCRGIGQRLIELAVQDAVDCGFSSVHVSCWNLRIPAFKLYQKCGFKVVKEQIEAHWFGAICCCCFWMEKKLKV